MPHRAVQQHNNNHQRVGAVANGLAAAHLLGQEVKHYIGKKRKTSSEHKGESKREVSDKKPASGSAPVMGVDTTGYRFNLGHKLCKGDRILPGCFKYAQTYSNVFQGGAGYQNVAILGSLNTVSQCFTSSGATYNSIQSYTALNNLNPYLDTTGSGIFGATQTAVDQFFLKQNYIDLEFTGFCTAAQFVDVYVCLCKRATTTDPVTMWTQGYTDDALGIAQAIAPTPGHLAGPTEGANNCNVPGTQPTDTSSWRAYWKILKKERVTLGVGETHKVSFIVDVGKVIKQVALAKLAGNYIPNVSIVLFSVQRGSIVKDVTAGGAALLPTFATTEVGYIMNTKYVMGPVKNPMGRLHTNIIAYNVPRGTAIADQRNIGETITVSQVPAFV